MAANDQRPIGVFDSGVGGLTVLKVLLEKFPGENFVYLGDSARLPYGNKSGTSIRRYTEQALAELHRRDCKCLIIACNSASSQFSESEFQGLPVYTVVGPGAAMALKVSHGRIGILGTRATVESGIYEKFLQKLSTEEASTSGKSRDLKFFAQAAPLFVPLAEEGWVEDPVTNLIVYRYLQPLLQQQVDTIILGCTHYPILKNSIQKVAGNSVVLVDSGLSLAELLVADFKSAKLQFGTALRDKLEILTTDLSKQFEFMAKQILPNQDLFQISVVDL